MTSSCLHPPSPPSAALRVLGHLAIAATVACTGLPDQPVDEPISTVEQAVTTPVPPTTTWVVPHRFQTPGSYVPDPELAAGSSSLALGFWDHVGFFQKNGQILKKAGVEQYFDIYTFYAAAGLPIPAAYGYSGDLRVIWDPFARRYWVVTSFTTGAATCAMNQQFWGIAMSRGEDPRDGFIAYKANHASPALGGQADYPQLGVDDRGLYVSAHVTFCDATPGYQHTLVISAASMQACGVTCNPLHEDFPATAAQRAQWLLPDGNPPGELMPATRFGSSTDADGHRRNFLARHYKGRLEMWAIKDALSGVSSVEHHSVPLLSALAETAPPDWKDGKQYPGNPATQQISTFGEIPQSAIVRTIGGVTRLHIGSSLDDHCDGYGRTTEGHWIAVDVSTPGAAGNPTETLYGCHDEAAPSTLYQVGYSGVGINRDGDVAIFGARFGASIYPSFAVWTQTHLDAGLRDPAIIGAGTGPWQPSWASTNAGVPQYADTVGVAVDGADDTGIWGMQMSAVTSDYQLTVAKYYGTRKPDLTVDRLTQSSNAGTAGTSFKAYPTIVNQGDGVAAATTGSLMLCPSSAHVGCHVCGSFSTPQLQPGQAWAPTLTGGVACSTVGLATGTWHSYAAVDVYGVLVEDTVANNHNPGWVDPIFTITAPPPP